MEAFCEDTAETTFRTQSGSCFCERVVSKFIVGAEHLTCAASHTFESRFREARERPDVTHVRVSGNEEEILATFGRGEDVKIPVAKLLEWLDIDLDRAEEGEASRRVTGVRIEASFNYYNFHQAPGLEERVSLDEGQRVCVVTLELVDAGTAEVASAEHVEEPTGRSAREWAGGSTGPFGFLEPSRGPESRRAAATANERGSARPVSSGRTSRARHGLLGWTIRA